MRILVVGTGGVGAAAATVAARRDFFESVTLADLDPARPRAVVDGLDDGRFSAAQVDASDQGALVALMRDADAVLNATDPRFNPPHLRGRPRGPLRLSGHGDDALAAAPGAPVL